MTTTTALSVIKKRVPEAMPKLGLVLGSGLGPLAQLIQPRISIDYQALPGFAPSSVVGHAGQLHMGSLVHVEVACLEGRSHWYEGAAADAFRWPIKTLKQLGCHTVIIISASGSINPSSAPGDLVLIKDHINFQFNNPLVGFRDESCGANARFVGMTDAYDPQWRQRMLSLATELGISLVEGVYVGTLGPSFETPAEIRAFKQLGADVVGMSTIPEVILARYYGLRVIAVSVVTNKAAGLEESALTHDVTLEGAALALDDLSKLISTFVERNF